MGVNDDVGRFCIEGKGVRIAAHEAVNETFEKEASAGDVFGVRQAELAIVFDEHRVARGFEEKNGRILRVLSEQREIVLTQLDGLIEISLAECGSTATLASGGQSDFESCGFENFYSGDADMRFMVADKGVVPENDSAARQFMSRSMTPEPFVKAVPGVV